MRDAPLAGGRASSRAGRWRSDGFNRTELKGKKKVTTLQWAKVPIVFKPCNSSNSSTLLTPFGFVQGDAGAHPGLVDVEIDAHHFALTHSHKIIDQGWIAVVLRPYKHHPYLGFVFLTIDYRHKRRILYLLLQYTFVRGRDGGAVLHILLRVH